MESEIFQNKLKFLRELFVNMNHEDILQCSSNEKTLQAAVDDLFELKDPTKNETRKTVTVSMRNANEEWDSDEESKLQLKEAVELYRKNKRNGNPTHRASYSKNRISRNNAIEVLVPTKLSTTQYKSPCPKENLKSRECGDNVNFDIENSGNAFSDVQQLINFFFLKNIDQTEDIETKNYMAYVKQGAIPKSKFREYSDGNASSGIRKNERSKLKTKINEGGNNSDHYRLRNKPNETNFPEADFPDEDPHGKIRKLSETICSKPFFYIVPKNPCPNFFFPRGSYYVVPKHPDSSSSEKIILHPEKTSKSRVNGCENFEVIHEESDLIKDSKIVNMNDLGKTGPQKMDSHINIGPGDVKINDSSRNLEANYDSRKVFDKSLGSPEGGEDAVGAFRGESRLVETLGESQDESVPRLANVTSAESERDASQLDEDFSFQEEFRRVQQVLTSEFPELSPASARNIASDVVFDGVNLEEYIAAKHLEEKVENQFVTMLLSLPGSNPEELRDKCKEFQGDSELVRSYVDKTLRENRQRELALEMQCLLPDADPAYLQQEIERLPDDSDAVNVLIDRLLDLKDYPKIPDNNVDPERQRLWRMYVENFNVKDYIRNVPTQNFESENKSKEYKTLALEFLQLRYPLKHLRELEDLFVASNYSITNTCNSEALSSSEPVRLAESSFKDKIENFDEAILKEICYVENKATIDSYLDELEELRAIQIEEARWNDMFLLCPLCCNDELVACDVVTCADGHLFCKDCVKRYVFVKFSDGVYQMSCPSDKCDSFFTYQTLETLLPDRVLNNITKKQQAAEVGTAQVDGLETCPYCEFAYIPNPEDKIFRCQNVECLMETCRNCHEKNHIPLKCEEIERPQDVEARKKIEETMTQKLVRICPTCLKKFVKIDGCNKMVCTCGTNVCYICRIKVNGYDHFQTDSLPGKCPLYTSNETLHTTEVIQAGIAARDMILQENPNVRILYDPTKNA